ncbi:uncharacterized protein LOC110457377 isoform X2 [Mizuhopecten yessoensis]|uniref:uncharacterized protein LOC110457377 isoform X2 n=1 Tax=Mizuhopecten yessoensis TaxID=6573 RepID=UPI000B45EBD8|nr:uncharacterized protein LOC110457377 isoform X2 [Mizuhopecten yessoensis]
MAHVLPGLLLILVVSLTLEAYPSGGPNTGRAQDLKIRQLITALRKLKTSGHDLRSTLYEKQRKERREEADKTEDIKENDVLEETVKELGKDDLSTKHNEEDSLPGDERSINSRTDDTGKDEEEEEEEDVRSDRKDVSLVERLAQKRTNTVADNNGVDDGKQNGNTRDHGHGVDIDRTYVNPNSDQAKLFGQFEVDIHGKKMTSKDLHKEKLEKLIGESHDQHPTPKPNTETEELSQQDAEKRLTRRNFPKNDLLWSNGIVPYEIETGGFSQEQIAIIEAAIDEMRQRTCVDFQPRSTVDYSTLGHTAFVKFISSTTGCWSYVGRVTNDRQQEIGLGPGCVYNPTVLHEMCHAIGMEHEQSRTDRDNYVTMQWDNIKDGENNQNMIKLKTKDTNPYDYESILQYGIKDYATGKHIMRFHDQELEFLADDATTLTFYDIKDITSSYRCSEKCGTGSPICQNGGFVDQTCGCLCPAGLDGTDCSQVVTDPVCGGTIDVTTGPKTIESPNYPQNYDAGTDCAWLAKGPTGKLIQLTINSLNLPYNTNDNRCYHWLEIRYNLMGQSGLKKCGDFTNEVYRTTWDGTPNIMYLMFDSAYADDKSPGTGFSLTVEAVVPGCASSPCVHGSCQDDTTTEFKCLCEDDYEGVHCDQVKASASFFCDFESADTCFFINDDKSGIDIFDWTWHTGSTISAGTGPSKAYNGDYYMYAEVSYRGKGENAALLTTEALPAGLWCLSFWYHMYGAAMGKFEVLGATDGAVWWSRSVDLGDQWNYASIEMQLSTKQKVALLATVGNYFLGDIAIDNLQLQQCVSPVHDRCDFEVGNECFLSQSQTDDFDWVVNQSGDTPSPKTGPTSAQEGSHYAFIEASGPFISDMAVLRSASTYPAGEYCLTFYYNMYGKKIGALDVSTLPESSDIESVFLKTGDQGQQWNQGVVSLDESEQFNLLFTAIRGASYTSDIALDNITFTSDRCGCLSNPCLNGGTCLSNSNMQTGYECTCPSGLSGGICEDVSVDTTLTCTFEDNAVCFLQQSRDDSFDWTTRERPSATPDTGPSAAAEGTQYAYIETSGLITKDDVAKFTTSPMSFEAGDRCLTFKYHMFGYSIGNLSVSYGDTELFHQQGDLGDTWNLANVDVVMSGFTELVMAASVGLNREYGDIAIDDVKLTPGSC